MEDFTGSVLTTSGESTIRKNPPMHSLHTA
uniref:Uncharacterized protein n=1 Tax=Siphoviridae sp. ctWBz6 TaxID=2825536 RepID=A0A8S5QG51_9CAUD|nr:MAG TPA: hypothetical protein [Siphoviridae sp. ctWBz6]